MQKSEATIKSLINDLLDLTENIIGFLKKDADNSNEIETLYANRGEIVQRLRKQHKSFAPEHLSETENFFLSLLMERDAEATRLYQERLEALRTEIVQIENRKKSLLLYK